MSRKRRTSRVLEKAELRTSGLKAINPTMDFGENRNVQNMTQLNKQDCGCNGAHGRSRLVKEQETLYNSVGHLTPGIPEHTTTSRILVERQ
jgi:hypothetical protein